MNTNRLLGLLLVLLLLLPGCASQQVEQTKATASPTASAPVLVTQGTLSPDPAQSGSTLQEGNPVQVLTKDQNGQELTISVNDTLNVTLDGNPTTGYVWDTKELDTSYLEQLGDLVYTTQSTGKLAGAGGTYLFSYKALKAGQTKLTLVYHRPWENNTPTAAEIFEVTVKIQE